MDAIEAIETRRTIGRLVEPAPGQEALARAFRAAMLAPDHKRLRPWRFLVIEGSARRALGALIAKSLKQRKPETTDDDIERETAKSLRAPMIIVAIAKVSPDAGIPKVEQLLAVGAATQNLMLALHAQGFGTAWKTGKGAYDPVVTQGLGLAPDEHIVGFVYAGSMTAPPPAPSPPDYRDFVRDWRG
ncbi:MAG TPA: nitroreductase [Xanthobacteraceae bacterium]|nr:nitroreductase [Xanthobacteraceae bacterium]